MMMGPSCPFVTSPPLYVIDRDVIILITMVKYFIFNSRILSKSNLSTLLFKLLKLLGTFFNFYLIYIHHILN